MRAELTSPSTSTQVKPTRLERWLAFALVLIPVAFNGLALLPELLSGSPSLNDSAFQYLLIQQASAALAAGQNPLDFWSPALELGFPQFYYYQHLPHLFVVFLDRLLLGTFDELTLFNLVRYVLLVGLPLTVFWSMRRMGLPVVAAGVAGAASSLLSGNASYGFEYDSYVWRGHGMYTQLWAMHLSFVTVAASVHVLRRGTGYVLAVAALSALALSHLIYAYMMAITLVLAMIVLVVVDGRRILPSAARLAIVAVPALAISSYVWLPLLAQSEYLSVSPYLQSWKYDSFGAPAILSWLVSGELLDHGRLPVLTALLAIGIVAAVVKRGSLSVLVLAGFVAWLVLYFGRPTLGVVADLLPFHEGILFHRFIGGMELFAIILMGLGGAAIWRLSARLRWRLQPLLAFTAIALLLTPAVIERSGYYADNNRWMAETRAAFDQDTDLQAILANLRSRADGRTYAGLRANWGGEMRVGPYVKVTDALTFYAIPAVSPPYQSLSLNSDLIWHFQDGDPAYFDLFDVRRVIVPSDFTVPDFYELDQQSGRYTLYRIPTSGVAEFVALSERRSPATQRALFDANLAWLQGPDHAAGRFIRWDFPAPASPPLLSGGCPAGGSNPYERIESDSVHLVVDCASEATLAFKMTYHPNWQVSVDGQPVETFMVSPSFVGANVPAGRHTVDAVYVASPVKMPLVGLGVVVAVLVVAGRRRLDSLSRPSRGIRTGRCARPIARPGSLLSRLRRTRVNSDSDLE